jgi:hypothetical protein
MAALTVSSSSSEEELSSSPLVLGLRGEDIEIVVELAMQIHAVAK